MNTSYATLDLETDPFKNGRLPNAFAGCYYDGKMLQVFWSEHCCKQVVAASFEHGAKLGGKLFVYAHNGGKFDFHFLLSAILERFNADDIKITAIGARIVEIKTPLCSFRDSYALIPKPLRSFGAKKEIDINKLESDVREQNKVEIIEYLKQDCVGLYDGLTEFFNRYGCKLTLASTTFDVLKKDFGLKPVKTTEHYDEKFRQFYFAGRVQFFSLGKHGELDNENRFKICDINSAFPAAMLSKHWFGSDYLRRNTLPKENKEQSFYHITCDSNGALPKRGTTGGVDFPVTVQSEFFATGWELFTGLELGLVKNVTYHSIYTPDHCEDFSGYVGHFYNMKKNATDSASRDFAKLFLNSCYGKFALNPREFRDVTITKWGTFPDPKTYKLTQNRIKKVEWEHSYDDMQRSLSFWQLPSNDPESVTPMAFYNVCTAASITGKVRAFLQRSISACNGVLYCDTDSIIATDTSALTLSDELGDWKLEKSCDCVWIGGKKLYVAHSSKANDSKPWKTASKGVRLPVKDLIAVCEGEAKSCTFDSPNYSVFSAPKFTTRTIRRDDKRKKRTSKNA